MSLEYRVMQKRNADRNVFELQNLQQLSNASWNRADILSYQSKECNKELQTAIDTGDSGDTISMRATLAEQTTVAWRKSMDIYDVYKNQLKHFLSVNKSPYVTKFICDRVRTPRTDDEIAELIASPFEIKRIRLIVSQWRNDHGYEKLITTEMILSHLADRFGEPDVNGRMWTTFTCFSSDEDVADWDAA